MTCVELMNSSATETLIVTVLKFGDFDELVMSATREALRAGPLRPRPGGRQREPGVSPALPPVPRAARHPAAPRRGARFRCPPTGTATWDREMQCQHFLVSLIEKMAGLLYFKISIVLILGIYTVVPPGGNQTVLVEVR